MRDDGLILAKVSRTWKNLARRQPRQLTSLIVAVFTVACTTAPPLLPRSTAPFLGPQDFSGTYTPKCGTATAGGEATYHGNLVFTNLDRPLVQAVLPPELKLAPNSAAPGLHPVIYLYGRPTDTKWIVADTPILIGPNYQELMLLVPFVQESTGSMWHNYVVRMYLDDANAIWIGNLFFAYAKEWGTMPNYQAIQTILAMPIVGRRSSGQLVCSYFELNYANATVAPVQSSHEFLEPFVPGMSGWVGLGTVSSVVNGAVAVRDLNWRIKQPPARACRF